MRTARFPPPPLSVPVHLLSTIVLQVPCPCLCGRHLLLLCWHDLRSRWHPRTLLQNSVAFLPATDLQLHFLVASALWAGALSQTPSASVCCPLSKNCFGLFRVTLRLLQQVRCPDKSFTALLRSTTNPAHSPDKLDPQRLLSIGPDQAATRQAERHHRMHQSDLDQRGAGALRSDARVQVDRSYHVRASGLQRHRVWCSVRRRLVVLPARKRAFMTKAERRKELRRLYTRCRSFMQLLLPTRSSWTLAVVHAGISIPVSVLLGCL